MHGNVLRTVILLTVLSGGVAVGGAVAGGTDGLAVSLVIVASVDGVVLFCSDAIALSAMRARPVSEVEYAQLYRLVRELCTTARQPVPRLYVSPASQPNAFAAGRSRRKAVICCTEGMLRLLDPDELRAVLGHELAHIRNNDILIMSVAAGLATVITFLATFAWLLATPFRPVGRAGGRLLELLLMLVLGPLAALVIRVSISRAREFRADAVGSLLAGDPLALARALRKIEVGMAARPLAASRQLAAAGHLMTVGPFRPGGFGRLFSTHPPVTERARRLESLAGCPR